MSDIKRFGAGEGLGFYWVRVDDYSGRRCILVSVDELGNVTRTSAMTEWDAAALKESEAVLEHLASGAREATAHLERRRKLLEENPPTAEPKPMDPATAKLYEDWD